jgi:tRNA wybutosine-synthesizing protein 3
MSITLPPSFTRKKQKIRAQLAVPVPEYDDLSPKGSIDEGIRDLIEEINACEGFVTTSSCAGRISVFAEGVKKSRNGGEAETEDLNGNNGHVTVLPEDEGDPLGTTKRAGVGGKGGGGKWLYVSHDPVVVGEIGENVSTFLGMRRSEPDTMLRELPIAQKRLIHYKFEPMVSVSFLYIIIYSISFGDYQLSWFNFYLSFTVIQYLVHLFICVAYLMLLSSMHPSAVTNDM